MVKATRTNYQPQYTYFIIGTDWLIQTNGFHHLFDEAGNETGTEAFSIKLESATDSDATLQAWLDNHAVLTVNSDKTQIQANNTEMVTWSITGQTAFDYTLMKNNIVVATGSINDGSLTFKTDEPDTYLIEFKIGNQTGYSLVEAV